LVKRLEPEGGQLPYLETFAKAAELSNFTAAAKALHLTQAAVSQRVHALERSLGQSVFQRRGGRVMLTEAGQALYEYARRILDLHDDARRAVTGQKSPRTGELLIAASSIPGEHLLPALLSEFRQRHSHIQVRASVSDSMAVIAQVEKGQVSLGLVGRKVDNPNLEFRFLARDRLVLIVPPTHPWAVRKSVSLGHLCGQPVILREPGSGLRHCFEKSLERAGRSPADLRVALELGSNEAIKEAVLRGVGVAVLSTYTVEKELQGGQLHGLRVRDLRCDRDMFVILDRRRVLPAPARLFLNFLETHPVASGTP
jgi:DNA-binding transcriptional LysR family regulator